MVFLKSSDQAGVRGSGHANLHEARSVSGRGEFDLDPNCCQNSVNSHILFVFWVMNKKSQGYKNINIEYQGISSNL